MLSQRVAICASTQSNRLIPSVMVRMSSRSTLTISMVSRISSGEKCRVRMESRSNPMHCLEDIFPLDAHLDGKLFALFGQSRAELLEGKRGLGQIDHHDHREKV